MTWKINYLKSVHKGMRKIAKREQERIRRFLEDPSLAENPRSLGKSLKGDQASFWRYRVGQYRIVCEILDAEVTVLVVRVGHRKDIYGSA